MSGFELAFLTRRERERKEARRVLMKCRAFLADEVKHTVLTSPAPAAQADELLGEIDKVVGEENA